MGSQESDTTEWLHFHFHFIHTKLLDWLLWPHGLQPTRLLCPLVSPMARILEWVAISSSSGSSRPWDQTRISCSSCIGGRLFTTEPPGKPICIYVCSVIQLCSTLWAPVDCSLSASSVNGIFWSRLPFPIPGDHPDPGIKPASPALAGGFFTTGPPGKPYMLTYMCWYICHMGKIKRPETWGQDDLTILLLQRKKSSKKLQVKITCYTRKCLR